MHLTDAIARGTALFGASSNDEKKPVK